MYYILSKSFLMLGLLALGGSKKSEDSSHDKDEQSEDSDDVKSRIEAVHDRFGHLKSSVYEDQSLVVLFGCLQQAYELHQCQVKELKKLVDPEPKQVCPPHFTHLPDSNKCYKMEWDQMDWKDAGIRCRSLHRDAHLVVVDDAAEQATLVTFLAPMREQIQSSCKELSVIKIWTAGQRIDPLKDTAFVWKPFNNNTMLEITYYAIWIPGQPGFEPGKESCIHFFSIPNLHWNDASCDADSSRYGAGLFYYKQCPLCEIDLD